MKNGFSFWLSNFIVQVSSRLLSFISNQILIRMITPSIFGIWRVRLPLLSDSLVFLSRDCVRKASARSNKQAETYSLLPFIFGLAISPIAFYLSYKSAPEIEGIGYAFIMTCIGSLLELLGECWAVPQLANENGKPVAFASAFAYLARSIIAVILAHFFFVAEEQPLNLMICFGFVNIIFGVLIILCFLYKCGKPNIELPNMETFKSLRPFLIQGALQWLFSQGEQIILINTNTPEQIGVYGLASDITSLVARLVFAPIETTVFNMSAANAQSPSIIDSICIITRVVVYIGLFAAAFGPSFGPPILTRFYGPKWTNDDVKATLSAFCRVMPFLALNGVTEANVNGSLQQNKLEKYNILLTVIMLFYYFLMYFLGKMYGPSGVVYSNGINMCLRSIMAITVIFKQYGKKWNLLPNMLIMGYFVFIAVIASYIRLLIVIAAFCIAPFIILIFDKEILLYIKDISNTLLHRHDEKKE